MRNILCFFFLFIWFGLGAPRVEHGNDVISAADMIRFRFLNLLRTRRSPQVPLTVEPAKPVQHPFFQQVPTPTVTEAMKSVPKADIKNLKEQLKEENLYLHTKAGEQGKLPVLILSLKDSKQKRRPAVVFLHSTSICFKGIHSYCYRCSVWDLIKLADYLTRREDIDPKRIGITGNSLGGMHAWFAAFADTRYAVVAPVIGVQGFRWAIDNDEWQARVDSIKPVFEKARIDLGKSAIDNEVVEKVWDRIAPGLASWFDSPYSIPSIAPRPLLILNGADDPRCPLDGIKTPAIRARKAYAKANSYENFKLVAQPGIGHELTTFMVKETSDWMDRFLKQY